MAQLTVYNNGKKQIVAAETGKTLLQALQEANIPLDAPCGGNGTCGKCMVTVEGEVSSVESGESSQTAQEGYQKPACMTRIEGDCTISLEQESDAVIILEGMSMKFPPNADATGIGAAVDIGTTTVVLYLIDLETGTLLSTQSGMNRQRMCGADVVTRVQYSVEKADGLSQLAAMIRTQIDEYIKAACEAAGKDVSEVVEITIAGNTIMQHIFAEISPKTIALAPFTPLSLFGENMSAKELGLCLKPDVPVYVAPCVAGYVGGDITAGLLSSGAYKAEKPSIFVDIGTNGEMALGTKDSYLCCATAAGPAFEGAEISFGMSGVAGAMSHVWLQDGKIQYQVIGGGEPEGLCGSGLVDGLAMLLEMGAVDETGRLLPPDEAPQEVLPYLGEWEGRTAFYLDENRKVLITDADVRKLQLAKAAVAAGIQTMLHVSKITEDDVDALYLAGGFGNYMNKDSAAAIGLIPKSLVPKLIPSGNSAGMGAAAVLVSRDAREELGQIQERCEYLELSGSQLWNDYYIECMMFE